MCIFFSKENPGLNLGFSFLKFYKYIMYQYEELRIKLIDFIIKTIRKISYKYDSELYPSLDIFKDSFLKLLNYPINLNDYIYSEIITNLIDILNKDGFLFRDLVNFINDVLDEIIILELYEFGFGVNHLIDIIDKIDINIIYDF